MLLSYQATESVLPKTVAKIQPQQFATLAWNNKLNSSQLDEKWLPGNYFCGSFANKDWKGVGCPFFGRNWLTIRAGESESHLPSSSFLPSWVPSRVTLWLWDFLLPHSWHAKWLKFQKAARRVQFDLHACRLFGQKVWKGPEVDGQSDFNNSLKSTKLRHFNVHF